MKKQRSFRYLGITLVLLPFLGIYDYMKTIIYIVIGITLIVNSRNLSQKSDSIKKIDKTLNKRESDELPGEDLNKSV